VNDAELFTAHLDQVTDCAETAIRRIESSNKTLRDVFVFEYQDWPEQGWITGFTFGLSDANHDDWKFGRPELMISVESADCVWPIAIGYLAERLRGKCPFCYGNTIDFKAEISEESKLDAFLIFHPLHLTREQASLKLNDFTCNISGAYPLYNSEVAIYEELGLERFWSLPDWDPSNVHRPPIVRPQLQ
jgi:hypothetical protein